jgi:hypothetical protein
MLADIFQQTRHLRAPHILVSHFAATVKNHGLNFVALAEEPDDLILAHLIVVLGRRRPEFHFFDVRGFLMLLLLVRFFILLVEEFPVVHEFADRGHGRGRDFHNVKPRLARRLHGIEERHHSELIARLVHHPDFPRPDSLIHPQTASTASSTFSDKPTSEKIPAIIPRPQQTPRGARAKKYSTPQRNAETPVVLSIVASVLKGAQMREGLKTVPY